MRTRTPQDRQPGGVVFYVISKPCALFKSNGLTSAAACRLGFSGVNGCISRGHHREGVMRAVMCKTVVWAEAEAVAPELRNLGLRDQTCTAVLATKDPNLLIHWSSAVAHITSYCWGPAIREVEVCGGEHSSACLLSEGPNMRRFGRCCGVRKLSRSSRFTHDSKHETLLHDVLY